MLFRYYRKRMNKDQIEILGDNHVTTSVETPLRINAFDRSDAEKIESIQYHFEEIMHELGLDLMIVYQEPLTVWLKCM